MNRYLLLFLGLVISCSSWAQNEKLSAERLKLVEHYLEAQKDFSGIVIIGSEGEIKFNKGYGFADRKNQVPFSDQTLSTIGSITKPFTATAILLLMEDGKLNPQEPISKYFDNVPEDKASITLHQLLTHSAGLPGAIGDDYAAIDALAFQKMVWNQPLLFSPGSGYEYSNVGYSLLGMIVEKVSGQSYSHFLQERIFKPAGMQTAGYFNPDADYKFLTHGYTNDGTDWGTSHDKQWNGKEPYWHLKANGGILMSAQDMFHWYLALKNQKILSPKSLQLQTTPYVDEGGGSYYGYGYALDANGESVQHNGGNRIFKADFRWFPKADFFFYSTTNDANVRLFRLNDEIMSILETGEIPEADKWEEIPSNTFPSDPRQSTAQAFLELIRNYSQEKADRFIPEYCTKGLIERNGTARLYELFDMLHGDASPTSNVSYFMSGNTIQLSLLTRDEDGKLKINLSFEEDKVDKLTAELEGI
jgi:CubicO group peptidase (beta-lactamase class C family)